MKLEVVKSCGATLSVIDGTSLCLGIVWVQFIGTYQLNEGQKKNNKQQENKHEANCARRVL